MIWQYETLVFYSFTETSFLIWSDSRMWSEGYLSCIIILWWLQFSHHYFRRVYLIGSVPGRHIGDKKTAFGHLKLRKVITCSCMELLKLIAGLFIGECFNSISVLLDFLKYQYKFTIQFFGEPTAMRNHVFSYKTTVWWLPGKTLRTINCVSFCEITHLKRSHCGIFEEDLVKLGLL